MRCFYCSCLLFLLCTYGFGQKTLDQSVNIIPYPNTVTLISAQYQLPQKATVSFPENTPRLKKAFNEAFPSIKVGPQADIRFRISDTQDFANEAYQLTIDQRHITITSDNEQGLFYGLQSLRQLLSSNAARRLPQLEINDAPRFPYRGMHLDVARHFFPTDAVKKYIDYLAYYKINTLHWHLTDDQGWRIEIKQYPKLQEVASQRKETIIGRPQPEAPYDGMPYGGYYTQEEIREVVAYAHDHFINVIPEIELPGHAQAVLAAYPEYGCTNEKIETKTQWGVSKNIYCPSEESFTFLENIFDEVMALFPSKYIHIGGDEVPKEQWEQSALAQDVIQREGLANEHELQSYFIARIESYLNEKGRSIIGWDEILEGGLAPNATVMSWRGESGGIEAAKQKHNVVMTPNGYLYFDHYQTADKENEPLAIGGLTPIEKVYAYNPVPEELAGTEAEHFILGAQANVWTEYIPNEKQLDYMIFPRILALSEITWTDLDNKDYDRFIRHAQEDVIELQEAGLNPATHILHNAASH